jgi:hypothetical protein
MPRRASLCLTIILAAATFAGPACAASGTRLADGTAAALATLATGEQLLIEPASTPLDFAGQTIARADARLIVGYASEVAYVLVLAGEARLGDLSAGPGRMLLFPPWGGAPSVQRFDARRLLDAWPVHGAQAAARADAMRIASRQRLALTFGRLQRTRFNVGASGDAAEEGTRRALVGGAAVRAVRFGGEADLPGVVQQVMSGVAGALVTRDAAALAQFIDPLPFGGDAGGDGRQALAEAIIAQRDWSARLAGVAIIPGGSDSQWRLTGPAGITTVQLRPTGGFPFVAAITAEAGQ